MKIKHFLFILLLITCGLPSRALQAQTVIDNTTVTTNEIYYVGTNTAVNSLVITNNGQLFVMGASSIIGNTVASSDNTALVTGSGSLWSNLNDFYVGFGGE